MCEHEWEPLEFKDGEKSKASVCLECGALKSGQGTMVLTADYIDFSPLTANPTLAEGRQWFRSDVDSFYWSPDGSKVRKIKTVLPPPDLENIKGFTYLAEGTPTDSWDFYAETRGTNVWIRQYSTNACFQAKYNVYGTKGDWTADNTFVDVPNKADNVYGDGEIMSVSMVPDGTVTKTFTPPAPQPTGFTWDGEYLWLGCNKPATVYKLTRDGTVKGQFTVAWDPEWLLGVSYDGTYLWTTADRPDWIYQLKTDGTQVTAWAAPGPNPRDVAWDGEYLWVGSDAAATIYKMTPGGVQKANFSAPTSFVHGLTWDGTYLWNACGGSRPIYQLKTDGTQVGTFTTPWLGPGGIGWDGKYMWHGSYSVNSAVYQLGNAGNFDLGYDITPV